MNETEVRKKLKAFCAWLTGCGAEVLTPTNEYEIVRFRGNRGTSIVYRNERGHTTFTGESMDAWDAFRNAKPWKANPPSRRRQASDVTTKALLERDGDLCFFCQRPLFMEPLSVEHLVPVASGGPNHIANYVLAHQSCNRRAGHMSAMEKVRIHVRAVLKARQS